MQINVTLYLKKFSFFRGFSRSTDYRDHAGYLVLCAEWVQSHFDTKAKKITLHLHTKPHDDAYLVHLNVSRGQAVVYTRKTKRSRVLERPDATYYTFDELMVRFPQNTAFLSVTPY